jgi:hypothetical protein
MGDGRSTIVVSAPNPPPPCASLRQARHAFELQHKAKRHSHVNRFNFAQRRGVELLFDMLPRRSLPVTVGQTTLHELAHVGERL